MVEVGELIERHSLLFPTQRSWRWGGGCRAAGSPAPAPVPWRPWESPDCILTTAEKCVCLWWLPPKRGRGCCSWKMVSSVLNRPTGYRHSQLGVFFGQKNSHFWPFKMGRIVQGIFISLWCVWFASTEARCHICHVCSEFYSLLLITLHRPPRKMGKKHDWWAHAYVSSPACTRVSPLLTCIPLQSWGCSFSPNIFCWFTRI